MEMIITKHMVRPSSPTPHELKTHKLSSIDQLAPPIYIPIVFFYENDRSKPHDEIVQRLKQSLSEILTFFYPLAGTIIANSFVDCDDSGVEMIEARVRARLSHFIENPRMEELKQLLPTDNIFSHDENLILSVKASFFDCGGFAVGVCMSHKVADAASLMSFVNAWAAACCGEEVSRIIRPAFDLAVHFPPSSALSALQAPSTGKEITFKRFVFDIKKLEKIRKEASSSSSSDGVKDPTKVEAVSGFLCQNFVEAYKAKSSGAVSEATPFIASHVVNLRPRTSPPLPYNTFGNCVGIENAVISSSEEDETPTLGTVVSKLRAAIKRVDNDYINNVIKNEKFPQTLGQAYDLLNNSRYCFVSSWRFPVYEADFGWGKPVWVCCGTMDMVVLMDNPTMDGIEAWVNFNDLDLIQTFQANYDKLIA